MAILSESAGGGIGSSQSTAFAASVANKNFMSVEQALQVLKVKSDVTRGELKAAFRKRIREVHPDVSGDDGTLIQKVRDAYKVVEGIRNPAVWAGVEIDEGLPAWAAGLLQGIKWTTDCPSYASFLSKPDAKALAVGEFSERTGVRPWAAAWGKFSQEEANVEALRICRMNGGGVCRLVYIGTGAARRKKTSDPGAAQVEDTWWKEQFKSGGDVPGFGWMPIIDKTKEKLVGYKTIDGGRAFQGEGTGRIRVPVFKSAFSEGRSMPYYYSPQRPRERIYMKEQNFQHAKPLTRRRLSSDPRIQEIKLADRPTWDEIEQTFDKDELIKNVFGDA